MYIRGFDTRHVIGTNLVKYLSEISMYDSNYIIVLSAMLLICMQQNEYKKSHSKKLLNTPRIQIMHMVQNLISHAFLYIYQYVSP